MFQKGMSIRSDHGKEFENSHFSKFCDKHGITHEFSESKTSQQNGVVERKNRALQEIARVMLKAINVQVKFWAKALNVASYTQNRVYLCIGTTNIYWNPLHLGATL